MLNLFICLLSIQYAIGNPLLERVDADSYEVFLKGSDSPGATVAEAIIDEETNCHHKYREIIRHIGNSYEDTLFGKGDTMYFACHDTTQGSPLLTVLLLKSETFTLENRALSVYPAGGFIGIKSSWTVDKTKACAEKPPVELVEDSVYAILLKNLDDDTGKESDELNAEAKKMEKNPQNKSFLSDKFKNLYGGC